MREKLEQLKPLLKTSAPFGTFILGDVLEDGSRRYFCAACGRRSDPVGDLPGLTPITHSDSCGYLAHARAISALRLMFQDEGIEV